MDLIGKRLHELLAYAPESGVFTWRVKRGCRPQGSTAGTPDGKGYLLIRIDGISYKAHRLAWLYVNGELPTDGIDHINRNKSDNRIANLRLATQMQNLQNQSISIRNTSGFQGVSWHSLRKKWMAEIAVNRKKYHLGLFVNISDAIFARHSAKEKLHLFNNL